MFGALCPSSHAIISIARFKNKQIINKTAYSTVIEVLVTESLNKLYKIFKIKVSAYVIVGNIIVIFKSWNLQLVTEIEAINVAILNMLETITVISSGIGSTVINRLPSIVIIIVASIGYQNSLRLDRP